MTECERCRWYLNIMPLTTDGGWRSRAEKEKMLRVKRNNRKGYDLAGGATASTFHIPRASRDEGEWDTACVTLCRQDTRS